MTAPSRRLVALPRAEGRRFRPASGWCSPLAANTPGERLGEVSVWLDSCIHWLHSSESAGHVVIGATVLGGRENLLGRPHLYQIAQVHEGCGVGNSRGLLQIVRDDGDAILLPQGLQGFLDSQC